MLHAKHLLNIKTWRRKNQFKITHQIWI